MKVKKEKEMKVSVVRTEVARTAPVHVRRLSLGTVLARVEESGAELIHVRQSDQTPLSKVSLFLNLLGALNQCSCDAVFLTEHDVLYPPHFFDRDNVPSDALSYATGGLFLNAHGYFARNGTPLSTLCGPTKLVREAIQRKLSDTLSGKHVSWVEPKAVDGFKVTTRPCDLPFVDVRHGSNHTGNRGSTKVAHTTPYWGHYEYLWSKMSA